MTTPPTMFRTKTEIVANWLRTEIELGNRKPGEQLLQDEIARTLAVSSTPVREAFSILQAEGYLSGRAHKGVFVAERREEAVQDAFEIRMILEAVAVERLACKHGEDDIRAVENALRSAEEAMVRADISAFRVANNDFHVAIARGSHSQTLAELIMRVLPKSRIYTALDAAWMGILHKEHEAIFEAIRGGQADRAGELMRSHRPAVGTPAQD